MWDDSFQLILTRGSPIDESDDPATRQVALFNVLAYFHGPFIASYHQCIVTDPALLYPFGYDGCQYKAGDIGQGELKTSKYKE